MKNNYSVYAHKFPNGKYYIGITRQKVEERWGYKGMGYKEQPVYQHILEFGWDNIEHIVLYKNIPKQEARQKEIELIKEYDSINNGYNIGSGGDCGGDPTAEFEYNGKIYTSRQLAELSKYDLTYHDMTNRINEHGWDIERALNTPKGKRNIKYEYNGNYYSLSELYEMRKDPNLTRKQLSTRICKHGWDIERAISQPSNVKLQPHGTGTCIYEYQGKQYNSWELCQISKVEGLKPVDITTRINKHHWSVERAITQPKRKR